MKNGKVNFNADYYIEAVSGLISGKGKRVKIITFGCQQNEADSEKAAGIAVAMGYTLTDSAEDADFILVNTCAIREHAEAKALSLIGGFKAQKKKNDGLIVAVMGCMAAEKHVADRLKEDFHFVSFTLEPNSLHKLPYLVYSALTDGKRRFILGEDDGIIAEGLPTCRSHRHRAWVSIMYGCNNFCSYCIVPYVRGRERSRESSEILKECRDLVSSGVKEITLLGQNVNSYRSDIDFAELISRVAEIPGDFIVRFMTAHPKDTSDRLIEAIASHSGKIAPCFHLPLQSGSNAVLREMNRPYTRERFMEIAKKLRAKIPGIVLTTDVIVGFPGEREEDFLDTLDVLRTVEFDLVFAFIYSERKGTRAATLSDRIPREVSGERLTRLLKMQDDISYRLSMPYDGSVQRVLVDSEEVRDGERIYSGRTPSSKLVHFTADNAAVGEFINVKITKCGAFDLYGSEHKEK